MSVLLKKYIDFLIKENLEKDLSVIEAFVEIFKIVDIIGDFKDLNYRLTGTSEEDDASTYERFSSVLSNRIQTTPKNIQTIVSVYKSVILFTIGGMDKIRDPNLFIDGLETELGSQVLYSKESVPFANNHRSVFNFTPTKQSYIDANYIIKELAQADFQTIKNYLKDSRTNKEILRKLNSPVYRGMRLKHETFNKLKVGSTFDHGDMSSWSFDKDMAEGFADAEDFDIESSVLFVCKNPSRGVPVEHLSVHTDEEEFLSGGLVRITDILKKGDGEWLNNYHLITIEYI